MLYTRSFRWRAHPENLIKSSCNRRMRSLDKFSQLNLTTDSLIPFLIRKKSGVQWEKERPRFKGKMRKYRSKDTPIYFSTVHGKF